MATAQGRWGLAVTRTTLALWPGSATPPAGSLAWGDENPTPRQLGRVGGTGGLPLRTATVPGSSQHPHSLLTAGRGGCGGLEREASGRDPVGTNQCIEVVPQFSNHSAPTSGAHGPPSRAAAGHHLCVSREGRDTGLSSHRRPWLPPPCHPQDRGLGPFHTCHWDLQLIV